MCGVVQAVLEVDSGVCRARGQADLDHGEGHVGLNADHGQLGASKSSNPGAGAEDVGCERIDHTKCRDVDDDQAGAVFADAVDEVPLEPGQLRSVESGVDRAIRTWPCRMIDTAVGPRTVGLPETATSVTFLSVRIGGVAAGGPT